MAESPNTTLVWFRSDLRLADNPALTAAVRRAIASDGAVIPLFIWAPEEEGDWAPGGARRWWLHQSLGRLAKALEAKGAQLILRHGPTQAALEAVIAQSGATAVYWNRRYEPAIIQRDRQIKHWLRQEAQVEARSFCSHLLFEPWTIASGTGHPYKVFTPFWKNCQNQPLPDPPGPAPEAIPAPAQWPPSVAHSQFGLDPKLNWKDGLAAAWTPGEAAAKDQLQRFLERGIRTYPTDRDLPATEGTSTLSPYLCHGEIGPRQIYHAVRQFISDGQRRLAPTERDACQHFLREIGWREFAYHVLYHFPHTPNRPLQQKYEAFPWKQRPAQLRAWQRGRTGYPIVDAGMRQLWQTGWMHNRVRMIAASFLVKDLLISWEEGARWFWDTLVDADLANNTLGWQWAGGCGADAAPYFRIFNPVTQGEKHDPQGHYTRRYVPELADLPNRLLFKPWEVRERFLATLISGETYPAPLVDHGEARHEALAALESLLSDSTAMESQENH